MKKLMLFIPLVLILGLALIVVTQKRKPTTVPNDVPDSGVEWTTLKGFQLSPKSYVGTDFTEFFETNKNLGGNAVGWTGAPIEIINRTGAPFVIMSLATKYNFTPIITVQSYDRESGKLRVDFGRSKDSIVAFTKKYMPVYFGIGVEVNLLYEKNPAEFTKFVSLFNEYSTAIHKVSPKTQVFTTFQLEHMKGLQGGLFGGSNNIKNNQWDLLAKFTSADILAFTTYPSLIYKTPSEIPNEYYLELYDKTAKDVIFTEIGWMRTNAIKDWEGSESKQEKFLVTFNEQTTNNRTLTRLWSFLYDQAAAQPPFDFMGLRGLSWKNTDKESPAENYWKKM